MVNYCFCTLALGHKSRLFAKKLAEDIRKYFPGISFVILTDNTDSFKDLENVHSFKHARCNYSLYNDRVFVVEKALSIYETAICIDADCRIYGWNTFSGAFPQGIVALSSYPLKKHFEPKLAKSREYLNKWRLIEHLAEKMRIDLNQTKMIIEPLYAVTKGSGYENFIKYWKSMADYLGLRRFTNDGPIIGLAAAKANFNVYHHSDIGGLFRDLKFFKDRNVKYKMLKGKEVEDAELALLAEHDKIDFVKTGLIKKIFGSMVRFGVSNYYYAKVLLRSCKNPGFYWS